MVGWPHRTLAEVPHPQERIEEALALAVREAVLGSERASLGAIHVSEVCALGRFRVKQVNLVERERRHEALLVPALDGSFDILVDPLIPHRHVDPEDRTDKTNVYRYRRNFRIAHEIGHSFFYDRSQRPARRLLPGSGAEERFCDLFASALLLPPGAVAANPPAPDSIFRLRAYYDVSAYAVAQALTRLYSGYIVLALAWRSHPAKGDAMRVQWGAGPLGQFIPRRARFDSEAVAVAGERGSATRTEDICLRWLKGRYEIQAMKLRDGEVTIAVLAPGHLNGWQPMQQPPLPLDALEPIG